MDHNLRYFSNVNTSVFLRRLFSWRRNLLVANEAFGQLKEAMDQLMRRTG
ncbi:hypothetical protein [Butyricimonas synergistica]|nr:hypothetical protein [Butyricimonas synergistica]